MMNVLEWCALGTLILLGFSAKAQDLTCSSSDSRALKDFMSGMDSAIDGWNLESSICCQFLGITCNSSGGVVKLELPKQKLVGYLSESMVTLHQLTTLNLSHNLLKGPIPIAVFQFPHLEVLDFSGNEFSGSLPLTLNLPSIKVLDLSDNSFKGPIAPGICTNSTGIQILKLGVNYFNGSIPLEFGSCTSLEQLSLYANCLSGTIPEFLLALPRLSELSLQDNMFSGQLTLGKISNLVHLDVSLNSLTGDIPDIFHSFPSLSYFSAYSNYLSGMIPPSLSNSRTISSLILRNNSLGSLFNINCSAMINLDLLDLGSNNFSGSIPDCLPSCPKLQAVNLARNNFNGQIPESFKKFGSLSYLSLSMCSLNNLSASLEILQHCPNLTNLVLSRTFHSEEIPSGANLEFKALNTLIIPKCGLTGSIPTWLSRSTKLMFLDLSLNQLTGQIPPWMGHLTYLFYLDLSDNSLTGEIPRSLTQLPRLISANISLQDFPLDFPIFMRTNTSRTALQYNYLIRFPPTMDLSRNILTGPIWPEFGNLKSIHIWKLNYNKLSGNIPITLSGMTSVETIDLSHNNLYGHIPLSLERLSSLSKFSVAYNKLTGIIPSGGQFLTFPSSSFEGNVGLCGEFVLKCQVNEEFPRNKESKNKKGSIISMPVWIGFGTGFLFAVVFWVVLSRK